MSADNADNAGDADDACELGLASYYRDCVRPLVRQPRGQRPTCGARIDIDALTRICLFRHI